MQNPGGNPLAVEQLSRLKTTDALRTGGNQQHITPLFQRNRLARHKAILLIKNVRRGISCQTHIHRSLVFGGPTNDGLAFDRVGWSHDRHVGHRTHNRQILDIVVRLARKSRHHSGIRRADLHIRVSLGD